ncbi:hypothetical protein AB0H34_20140 [Saccharopolyspora shandongensis]
MDAGDSAGGSAPGDPARGCTVDDLTGHPARDITDFARDYAAAFIPA